ncbi:uncharacterized protein LOC134820977 [Bolinopsis microptera]|uniref:uncharacterized protein LOC134820977 n=1 Tax=Bolinopsis microptera TaxID=2820187 RepID=UPI003078F8F9
MKIFILLGCVVALGLAFPSSMGDFCFFNQQIYNAGDSFMDGCSSCTCNQGGEVSCDHMLCPPCHYMDGSGKTMRAWGPYSDGCNQCICTHDGLALCTSMWCPHKCHVTNDDGAAGWVDFDTTLIHMPEEEDACPKVCTCKPNTMWLGTASYECEEAC